jgi:predicted amidohydrolase YtcJ
MSTAATTANLILCAERVHTLGRRAAACDAIAIAGERILAVGRRRDLLRKKPRAARVIELSGATITPGLVDCHTHFFYWALERALVIDLAALTSRDATLRKINKLSVRRRVGEWIVARGLDYNRWDCAPPTAEDLDAVAGATPLMVHSRDGHTAWLNSAGLKRAGIHPDTPDPPGGRYLRDEHGHPNGGVQERAIDALPNPVVELAGRRDAKTVRTIDRAVRAGVRVAHALGLTGAHCVDDSASLYHLQRLSARRALDLRITHAIPRGNHEHATALGLRSGVGDDWFRIGGIKIFSDGALGSQTAYMLDPYPGSDGHCGVPNVAGEELRELVGALAPRGWAVWIHAIGDRAVREAVDAICAVRRADTSALPHRIEHAQCVRAADIRRMARRGIVASVQPCHIIYDIPTADRHWPGVRRFAYPLRQFADAGVTLAAGSDVPIESLDPRRSFFGAVQRAGADGVPAGGWFPEQRLSAREVLAAFTTGAARAAGTDPVAATIGPGARADLTVWADDPLRCAAKDLLDIGIAGCIVGGQPHLTSES